MTQTSVTPLSQADVRLDPDWDLQPNLVQTERGAYYSWKAEHPKRGSIVMMLVRDFTGKDESMWDQPVFFEPEGSIFLPFYHRDTQEGKKTYVGLEMVVRPIVMHPDPEKQNLGVLSIEAPRGLGSDVERKVEFKERKQADSLDITELEEETRLVPTQEPIPAGRSNPNTSYWAHPQNQFLVPVDRHSQVRFPDEGVRQETEKICNLVFYEWPDEIRQLAKNGRDGDGLFLCAMTQSILFQLFARSNELL